MIATLEGLPAAIEHTLLKANASASDVDRLCDEALEHGFGGICVNPARLARCGTRLGGSPVTLVTVVGFPLGATVNRALIEETHAATSEGAQEIDMVIPIGAAIDGDFAAVEQAVAAVVGAAEGRPVKAILETGYLAVDPLSRAAKAALAGGAAFLKTSTGFGPRGASVADVALLVELCAGNAQVKASGGIRSYQDARDLLAAGATRLGTSSGVSLVQAWHAERSQR